MSTNDNRQAIPPPSHGVILDPGYSWTHPSRMLQCMIDEFRQYFDKRNIARILFQFLSDTGMTFYRAFSNAEDEGFVPASNDEAIECIQNALVMGYDSALQLFHNTYSTRAQQPTQDFAGVAENRDTLAFLNQLLNCDTVDSSFGTSLPASTHSMGHANLAATASLYQVLLHPQHGQLATNKIIRHVTEQVRIAFSHSNLVNLALQRAAQRGIASFYSGDSSFTQVPDYQVRAFLEQAIIHGYTPAVQEFHDCALQVEAAALAGPHSADDHSLGPFLEHMEWEGD